MIKKLTAKDVDEDPDGCLGGGGGGGKDTLYDALHGLPCSVFRSSWKGRDFIS